MHQRRKIEPNPPAGPSSSTLPSEVRFEPLVRSSRNLGRPGVQDADGLLKKLKKRRPFPLEFLELCALHPDERVPIALLESGNLDTFTAGVRSVLPRLVSRAIRDAGARGEIWTPLLDALSKTIWPIPWLAQPTLDEWHRQDHYFDTVVIPWIEQQKDPGVLRHVIVRMRSQALGCCIAEMAPVVDAALLDQTVEEFPRAIIGFARNEHLPPTLQRRLLERIVNDITKSNVDPILPIYSLQAYKELVRRGIQLDQNQIRYLLDLLEKSTPATNERKKEICGRAFTVLVEHVHGTGNEEVALEIIRLTRKARDAFWALLLFMRAPDDPSRFRMTIPIARSALRLHGEEQAMVETVAKDEHARQDPETRRLLLKSSFPEVWFELAMDGREEEFLPLFRRLVKEAPPAAAKLLERRSDVARRLVSHKDLKPLLRSSDRNVRVAAIGFLGQSPAEWTTYDRRFGAESWMDPGKRASVSRDS